MKKRRVAALVLALLTLSCREGVPPFTPPDFEFGARRTFGTGQDLDPRWLPDGSAVIYHTDDFGALPGTRGVLLKMPAQGGTALPLLEDVQRSFGRPLVTPVVSPDGQRVAYIDLIRIDPVVTCVDGLAQPPNANCRMTQPVLDSAALRVRRLDAAQPPTADPSIGMSLAGTDPLLRIAGSGSYAMQALPFQQQYRETAAVLLRASWAPDNQRLVFSNGTGLFVWRVGDAAAIPVAGTADGVSPAWSPNGDRIAFTQLVRTDSAQIRCTCLQPGSNDSFATHFRMTYTVSPRLVLVRPDGTDRVELGEGEDAAWSPDGSALYVRRSNQIVRVTVAGGASQVIPNTMGARFPAISPDGRLLALSRPSLREDYDIWVVSLSQ